MQVNSEPKNLVIYHILNLNGSELADNKPNLGTFFSSYTVPKAILRKEMFVSTERNVSPVLKKCFSTANSLSGKGKPVLIKTNVSFAVFLSLRIKILLPFCSVPWGWGKIFFHLTQMFLYSVFLSMRVKLCVLI